VTVHSLDLLAVDDDCVSLRIRCTAGFYVRALAHDLGQALGTGAHLAALRRTASGELTIADAVPLNEAERDPAAARAAVIPLDRMLPDLTPVVLTDEGARRLLHGRDLRASDYAGEVAEGAAFRLFDQAGQLLGIGEAAAHARGLLHPAVVLV